MEIERKQAIVFIFTILAFIFLAYQIYCLIVDDVTMPDTISSSTTSIQSNKNNTNISKALSASFSSQQQDEKIQKSATQQSTEDATLVNDAILKNQKAYLQMVNMYELAKMKRQLLEEQAAIATAEQRIAKIHQQTQLITHGVSSSDSMTTSMNQNEMPYHLNYIDQQDGRWTATINENGKYQTVTVGSVLLDGSQVISIGEQGVTLKHKEQQFEVTFNGVNRLALQSNLKKLTMSLNQKKNTLSASQKVNSPKTKPIRYVWREEPFFQLASAEGPPKIIKKSRYSKSEKKILKIPASHYTIQLIGDYHLSKINQFVKTNAIHSNYYQFFVNSDHKKWFIVIYGNYISLKKAKTALATMPSNWKHQVPWIRQFAVIQHTILSR